MSRVLGLIVAALALGVAGCGGGGGDGGDSAADPSASPPSTAADSPRPPADSAVDAGEDLSNFVCTPNEDGEWNASGVITNSSGKPADYRVTVVVSEGPGVSVPGKRRTLTRLTPGTPEPFDVKTIPAVGDTDATCQVEVLRLP